MNAWDGIWKSGENDEKGVNVVQARRCHFSHAPGPEKDFSCAEHHESFRLLSNNAKQQTQILKVIGVQEDTTRHPLKGSRAAP